MAAQTVSERYAPGDIVARGKALYEQRIRDQVETSENIGKILIINVETGEWEMGDDPRGDDDLAVSRRAAARFPDAGRYGMRIGYPAFDAVGATLRPLSETRRDEGGAE